MNDNAPGVRQPGKSHRALARCARVLVVDDYRDNAESMAILLRLHGHQVETALSGHSAVRNAQARPPEVVLLDISMPGMDGFEVARQLRRMLGRRVVLIAITARVSEDDPGELISAGFDHHFVKPADPEEVQRVVADPEWSLRVEAWAADAPSKTPS